MSEVIKSWMGDDNMKQDLNVHPEAKGHYENCDKCGLPKVAPRNYTGDMCQCKELKKMEIMRKGDDIYCRDAETHEFLGILRHSIGFYGESTGIFMGMKTTSLDEVGYEEIPSGYIPEGKYYIHNDGKWQLAPISKMDVRERF